MKTPVIDRSYYTIPGHDLDIEIVAYEITWALPNGDWTWVHTTGLSFQGACRLGLSQSSSEKRLVGVNRIPPRGDEGEQS